jgi:hypothetical protein
MGEKVEVVEVEVEAYTACSPTAPASWLSAALSIANWHFILKSAIHFPD